MTRPGTLFPEQCREQPRPCSRRCAKPASGQIVFSSTCAIYGIPDSCRSARTRRSADQSLWRKQADDRADAALVRPAPVASVALRYFNAAGADPEGEIGEEHEPETHLIPLVLQAALGSGGDRDLRHRLSDAGRHRDPRLYPCPRFGRGACAALGISRRRRQRRAQPRHRRGLFGARGDRRGRASPGGRSAARNRAPTGRPADAVGGCEHGEGAAGLDAGPLRPRRHPRQRVALV